MSNIYFKLCFKINAQTTEIEMFVTQGRDAHTSFAYRDNKSHYEMTPSYL